MCTSCAQKLVEHCKEEKNSGSISSADIDAISNSIENIFISNDDNDDDDELFQDPPPKEECPLCMLPMPRHSNANYGIQTTYQPCCGKTLCWGCAIAFLNEMDKGKLKRCCAFCRVDTYI